MTAADGKKRMTDVADTEQLLRIIQSIPDWYEYSLLMYYEGTYFPEHMENAGRASYVERNQEMIKKSYYCIF